MFHFKAQAVRFTKMVTNERNIKLCFNILQRLQYIFVKYHKDIKIFVKICFSTGKVLIFCALRTRKQKALVKTENRNVK